MQLSLAFAPPAPPDPLPAPARPEPPSWWPGLWLRLAFTYFLLFDFEGLLGFVPGAAEGYRAIAHVAIPWVGAHVLRLASPITRFPGGSGDTTYNYVELLCFGVLAIAIAPCWLWLDRRRASDSRLAVAFLALLRFPLASALIGYGLAKVFKLQFPFPSLTSLLTSYGDSSPMHLLWTFMGYSPAYTLFAGTLELAAGILLFSRRTTTLGALLAAAVMGNVVMLNLCYDVPVKLYASHLFAMAALLVAADARRLLAVLVLDRPTQPRPLPELASHPEARRLLGLAKGLCLAYFLYLGTETSLTQLPRYGDARPKPPLYGAYDVLSCAPTDPNLPLGDAWRWKSLVIDRDLLFVKTADGGREHHAFTIDPKGQVLTLDPKGEPQALRLEQHGSELWLRGEYYRRAIAVHLAPHPMPLVERGFHWVNEYPHNS